MARKPVHRTPLGRRLAEVREKFMKDRDEFAAMLGSVSVGALSNYERGDNLPDAAVLAAYHQLGVNLSWLISEKGEMFDDPSKAPAPSTTIDPLLMEKLYKAVERAYKDVGQRPPGHRLAHEATTLFNVLLGEVKDIRNDALVDAAIPVLARQLVERLMQAAAEPGTGKRSA